MRAPNISSKEFVDAPFINQVEKEREKWVYSNRLIDPRKGQIILEEWHV